jgi:polyisoprenoid-binding protein YceI
MWSRILLSSSLIVACDSQETTKTPPGPQDEFSDSEDIPTPGDDVEDVEPDDTDTIETGPVSYTFDDVDSLIYVQVFKDKEAWGSALAHDHVIRATSWTGSAELDIEDFSSCYLSFEMPVQQLIVDEAGMRDLVGYEQEVSDDDRDEIRDNMLSGDQLNVSAHDAISFVGTNCKGSDDTLLVDGELTVAGGTGQFTVELEMVISDGRLYLQGGINAQHDDFGMTPYSAYGGFVRNNDPLIFTIDVVGEPSE